jgi:large subunit ribosomal protein L28
VARPSGECAGSCRERRRPIAEAGFAGRERTAAERQRVHCWAAMSRVCAICGKKPGFGHSRSHSMVATKRRFNPNLQRVRVMLDGHPTRAYVCTRCLKAGKVQKTL